MTTWNTTYNFNQNSMNFGQAMLYGAFGQLTGMMGGGCFGGGYGMGSYGMGMGGSLFSMMGMGGYGFGAGCCGMYNYSVPDSYVGAQCGLTAMNVLFQGIGGYIKSKKAENTENNAALNAALKTLNNSTDPKKAIGETFKSTSYDTAIRDAARSAIKTLDYKPAKDPGKAPDAPNASDTNKYPDGARDAQYIADKKQYDEVTKPEYDKEKAAYDEAQEKLPKHQAMQYVLDNIDTITSDDPKVSESLVGAEIVAAVKAREDAKAEFENAKEVVQNYLIDSNKKEYNSQLKKEDIDNVKKPNSKEDDENKVKGKQIQDEFRAALKAYGNNKNEANKTKLINKYDELIKFKEAHQGIISDGYMKTIESAMSTYGLK